MSKKFKKDIKKYLSDVKKRLHCGFNLKKAFLSELKNEISNYLAEHQTATIENIINELGSPEQIVSNFKDYDYNLLKRKVKFYLILEIFFIILTLVLLVALIYTIYSIGGDITISNPYN